LACRCFCFLESERWATVYSDYADLCVISLRLLSVLCVSAVEKCGPDHYRRDAENAEERRDFLKITVFSKMQSTLSAPHP